MFEKTVTGLNVSHVWAILFFTNKKERLPKTSLILLTLTLAWYDELWDNRKNLTATMFQHVVDSLASKELIWVNGLA